MSRCSWLALAFALAAPGSARADERKLEHGKPAQVQDVRRTEWTAAAEAGLVLTTGNSEPTTATGGLKASRKTGANKLAIEASGTYAKSGLRVLVDRNGNGTIDDPSEITTVESLTAE